MDNYTTTFETWKSARSDLERPIQSYIDTCAALCDAASDLPASATFRQSQKLSLAELEHELTSLALHEENLRRARRHLCQARNTLISPISSLPSDVLHMILLDVRQPASNEYSTETNRSHKIQTTSLSSVCHYWRHLMIQSPLFWTYLQVDLGENKSGIHLAKLWSERCKEIDLDLTMRRLQSFGDNPRTPPEEESIRAAGEIVDVLRLLTPMMPRVRTLKIWACYASVLKVLLKLWVQHGTVGRATSLAIDTSDTDTTRYGLEAINFRDETKIGKFFSSLRSLTVQNLWTEWPIHVYAELLELRLGSGSGRLYCSLQELVEILPLAPKLRVLIVSQLDVRVRHRSLSTVALDELEVLRLDSSALLRVITSKSKSIELCWSGSSHESLRAVQSFIARTKITRLYVLNWDSSDIGILLTPMYHLHSLAVQGLCANTPSARDAMRSVSAGIWPELREMHLINCVMDSDTLRQFVSIRPPETLIWHRERPGLHHNHFIDRRFHRRPRSPPDVSVWSVEHVSLGDGVRTVVIDDAADLPINSWRCIERQLKNSD